MTTGIAVKHWLLGVVERAGLTSAAPADIGLGKSVTEAWAEIGRAYQISDSDLASLVAAHFKIRVADFGKAESRATKLIPEDVASRLLVFPLREDDRCVVVATSDPTDLNAEESVGFASGRTPMFEVAPPAVLADALRKAYSPDSVFGDLLEAEKSAADEHVDVIENEDVDLVGRTETESGPVVKLTNMVLREAVTQNASDIHIEPGRAGGLVRFRVDGVLRQHMKMPMPALIRVVSRIKILGDLDIADRLRPQDGRARIKVRSETRDLRISTVPTRDSEKAVIRILNPQGSLGLGDLGMADVELATIRRMLSNREGIVLVTGPTGSGKTTTLYGALRELATGEVNIMTVEDPVEYELVDVTQIQVEPRQGVTFASALRACLRQDPDVILVGEIRDLETAEIAVQASLTGHLVLATLHTNEALGVVARLRDLGLDVASIAESLKGTIGQRLLRRVCPSCCDNIDSAPLTETEAHLFSLFGVRPAVRSIGCEACGQTGYRGRLSVVEAATVTPDLQESIARNASMAELRRIAAANSFRTLRQSAMEPVRNGLTTLDEVARILGEATEAARHKTTPDQLHVLVVDDDAVIRRIARGLLEKNNFRVSEVADGSAALEHLAASPDYDLVVLDLNMPKVGGREVLRSVRGSTTTVGLPVVVLTGSEVADEEVALMEEGADDYIRKPIDPPRFVARIKAALRRAGVKQI
jgi:type II secretory ATPase GspE/PulE/Tfp pilus assembly ATPase PilB-like protein/ActR/RegA family two-component response regulator